MKNAHERFGALEYTKHMKDTTTRIRLRLARFIGEVEREGTCKAHLISVLGGDSEVGAIWAAVVEQNQFTVEGTDCRSYRSGRTGLRRNSHDVGWSNQSLAWDVLLCWSEARRNCF
jgi:uncharacterized NAD-dependent epimerase/dehydratase family protein